MRVRRRSDTGKEQVTKRSVGMILPTTVGRKPRRFGRYALLLRFPMRRVSAIEETEKQLAEMK
jgi:hypothetical protein